MITFDFEQRSAEWYAVRLGILTASTAHTIAVAGKGLETLCLEKANELITKQMPEQVITDDMQRGIELEDEARNYYELKTGEIVKQVGFVKIDENDSFGCSPDGLVGDDGLIEIKCKKDTKHLERILGEEIEPKYLWQMQMQMLVCGRKWCDYVSYNPNFPQESCIVIERVYADAEMFSKLEKGIKKGTLRILEILEKYKQMIGETK